ncbi:MAG: tRNA (cytidine(34)-2'-O)-methyltransferase [Acidobacteria bacterium]|nr:tRNA (cytidine(34)-2'-O)-methyltransferase [Acidobacteriota bacterium]
MKLPHRCRSPFQVVLVEPEIPPNTGNIARLCGATLTPLHLVGRLGFRVDQQAVRRAGLDYWDEVEIHYHRSVEALQSTLPSSRLVLVETVADHLYTEFVYRHGDCLVFGRETGGLPTELLNLHRANTVRIPMHNPAIRSLNLANSVAIVLYEALRQVGQTSPCTVNDQAV